MPPQDTQHNTRGAAATEHCCVLTKEKGEHVSSHHRFTCFKPATIEFAYDEPTMSIDYTSVSINYQLISLLKRLQLKK